jgi:hypothetical protein
MTTIKTLKLGIIREHEQERLAAQAALKPQYIHDCDACRYLGRSDDEIFDLYFCAQSDSSLTVIARFSDEGPDYKSGLCFVEFDAVLSQAYKLAVIRNFLD